jgi:hypothetical protein
MTGRINHSSDGRRQHTPTGEARAHSDDCPNCCGGDPGGPCVGDCVQSVQISFLSQQWRVLAGQGVILTLVCAGGTHFDPGGICPLLFQTFQPQYETYLESWQDITTTVTLKDHTLPDAELLQLTGWSRSNFDFIFGQNVACFWDNGPLGLPPHPPPCGTGCGAPYVAVITTGGVTPGVSAFFMWSFGESVGEYAAAACPGEPQPGLFDADPTFHVMRLIGNSAQALTWCQDGQFLVDDVPRCALDKRTETFAPCDGLSNFWRCQSAPLSPSSRQQMRNATHVIVYDTIAL